MSVLVAQSCLTLCDSMVCSPLCFSVHGILQARILEWVAIPFPIFVCVCVYIYIYIYIYISLCCIPGTNTTL